ncbi:class I SAM-dependent methyltransferase [Gloeocapsopsis dulcis]|uniref:SAM-dependent methyltransferase n=1 Tax=Gloeocapsopsis dulcis AAB1 = 1H9 TaxID=1433147 RepID=A0A6N8FVY6_9CHRO|nr:class I SAM-dependent methyltransferase [Gloeocapsopsis dulcis]MUL37288.1 SAM-dependent methyltransferase [Gloeocapsopsis dulcis AAB1 = 1H9]WNN91092.1 class I SAM-dependent methyltransferase [Gloeocapsopsis dulcis]
METTSSKYEYSYVDSNSGHHHTYLLSPLLEILSKATPTSQQKLRILDLGCGNGSLSNLVAQQGYEVVGVEASESGYNFATLNFPSCQFIQASIYELPYEKLEHSFDIVISSEVIEHLLYPRELLKAAKRCLKRHGRLIITTPYHGYFKNVVMAISGKMDGHFTALWDGGHVKFFSVKTLTALLQEEGFTNLNFKFAGRFPYLWKSMLCSSSFIEA